MRAIRYHRAGTPLVINYLGQIVKTNIREKKKFMSFGWNCIYTILCLDEVVSVHVNLWKVVDLYLPYVSDYKTHPPNLGGKWGCIL